jgi:hypothetical protein
MIVGLCRLSCTFSTIHYAYHGVVVMDPIPRILTLDYLHHLRVENHRRIHH